MSDFFKQKSVKVCSLYILFPDAVVHPWAVVIEFHYTVVAQTAVLAPWRPSKCFSFRDEEQNQLETHFGVWQVVHSFSSK